MCIYCGADTVRVYIKKNGKELHQKTCRRCADLWKTYRIRSPDYDRMHAAQNGCCAICKTDKCKRLDNIFCVDHDHDTGKIRGLLCDRCNKGIGFLPTTDILTNSIYYLTSTKPTNQ